MCYQTSSHRAHEICIRTRYVSLFICKCENGTGAWQEKREEMEGRNRREKIIRSGCAIKTKQAYRKQQRKSIMQLERNRMFVGFGIGFTSNYREHLYKETKKLHLRGFYLSKILVPVMASHANLSYIERTI